MAEESDEEGGGAGGSMQDPRALLAATRRSTCASRRDVRAATPSPASTSAACRRPRRRRGGGARAVGLYVGARLSMSQRGKPSWVMRKTSARQHDAALVACVGLLLVARPRAGRRAQAARLEDRQGLAHRRVAPARLEARWRVGITGALRAARRRRSAHLYARGAAGDAAAAALVARAARLPQPVDAGRCRRQARPR